MRRLQETQRKEASRSRLPSVETRSNGLLAGPAIAIQKASIFLRSNCPSAIAKRSVVERDWKLRHKSLQVSLVGNPVSRTNCVYSESALGCGAHA